MVWSTTHRVTSARPITAAAAVVSLPMEAEALKGHLDGLLLAVLEAGPAHGYALMDALRSASDGTFDLPTGTVYPALHRLERAGLVRAVWSTHSGRRRRIYELTPDGGDALAERRHGWRRFSGAVSAVLEGGTPWAAPA